MKKLILSLLLIFGIQNLASASVPSCLQDNGVDQNQNRLIDGGYVVSIDTSSYDKASLLSLLGSFNANSNIYPPNFPSIWGNVIEVTVGPNAISSDETFASIEARVESELANLQAKSGVTVRCVRLIHPRPGVTASN